MTKRRGRLKPLPILDREPCTGANALCRTVPPTSLKRLLGMRESLCR
jgi:hypothetical protein